MIKLPVIVGMGGINPAGRTSGFHSYKRMLCDALPEKDLENTWHDLAHRMGLSEVACSKDNIQAIKDGTLIRKIDSLDTDKVRAHHKAHLNPDATFNIKKAKLPKSLDHCDMQDIEHNEVMVTIDEPLEILLPDTVPLQVTSAGNIPNGFDPGTLYNSHHHPRGLKLAVYGASDALNSLGIEWSDILSHIHPDEVSVYAGSALSQVDEHSMAGLVSEVLLGNRVNSKMMAMSLAEMAADFVNGYMINSVGSTGHNMGACATFLYNLKQGAEDIQQGRARVVLVGSAEAPIEPPIIDGFRIMGALATDEQLCALDKTDVVDNRRACRPFSTNIGFTLAESSQFFVLMDDELALKLGLNILGSVGGVFINADGNKKSIASPGVGNYITVAKAAALTKAIIGQSGLERTFVQAHGTGTPQNRTTESHILNEVAKTFSIKKWPVAAIKSYLGHSISAAGGDQLATSLGVWQYGWIPGIKTIDHIANDVHQSHLNILMDHLHVGEQGKDIDAVLINSKGFGGNNATAVVLSPHKTMEMLQTKYGSACMQTYQQKNDLVKAQCKETDIKACHGDERIIYSFGEKLMNESSISMTPSSISLSQFTQKINLPTTNPYQEYTKLG